MQKPAVAGWLLAKLPGYLSHRDWAGTEGDEGEESGFWRLGPASSHRPHCWECWWQARVGVRHMLGVLPPAGILNSSLHGRSSPDSPASSVSGWLLASEESVGSPWQTTWGCPQIWVLHDLLQSETPALHSPFLFFLLLLLDAFPPGPFFPKHRLERRDTSRWGNWGWDSSSQPLPSVSSELLSGKSPFSLFLQQMRFSCHFI